MRNRLFLFLLFVLIGMFCQTTSSYGQTRQESLSNLAIKSVDRDKLNQLVDYIKNPKMRLLSRKDFPNGDIQVVFRLKGKRYTIFYIDWKKDESLWFWVRPEDTIDKRSVFNFTDGPIDGIVNSVAIGADKKRRYLSAVFNISEQDLTYRINWQKRYNDIIEAALFYYRH